MTPLPWFAFDREAYLRDTMHLTTEEHGAYLLLMLAYYGTGKPLPGYDRALASITKLTLERWATAKVGLEPLFQIEEGVWKHKRIERELLEASSKHAKAVERAKTASAASHAKHSSKAATSQREAFIRAARRQKTPTGQPKADPPPAPSQLQADPEAAHLHKQNNNTDVLLFPRDGAKHDDDTKAASQGLKEGEENPLGVTLPETWVPSEADEATAAGYGIAAADLEAVVIEFHRYNAHKGTFSKNWSATWGMWCSSVKKRMEAQPKPRVEVSNKTYEPTERDWQRGIRLFLANESNWPFKQLGPQPGALGCKCPPQLLIDADIDPVTGITQRVSSEKPNVA